MRRNARIDDNQPVIVNGLTAVGATVQSLAPIGGGCPDLLVGFRGRNFIIEVKNPARPPNKRRLRPDQVEWHHWWAGQKAVVETLEEALVVIGAVTHGDVTTQRAG